MRKKSLGRLPQAISCEECVAVDYPVASIKTDPKRFQNRNDAFSEASALSVAENYDANKFDPIVVWIDPLNEKTYVLSGHSRYEGMKRRGARKIPVRFFEGTEEDAIQFARVDANRAATAETIAEDVKAYRLMRDGDPERGIKKARKAELKRVFKAKVPKLEAYTYLSPDGQFMTALAQEDKTEYPYVERLASWTGELRKEYVEEMTDMHEDDVFFFLYSDDKRARISRDEFDTTLKKRLAYGKERLFPECKGLECGDIRDLADYSPHKTELRRLEALQAQRDTLRSRLRTTKPELKVWTDGEKEFLKELDKEWVAEIEEIKKAIDYKDKAPGLFGVKRKSKKKTNKRNRR